MSAKTKWGLIYFVIIFITQAGIFLTISLEEMTTIVASIIAIIFGLITYLCMDRGYSMPQKKLVFWSEVLSSIPVYFVINKYVIFLIQ